MNKIILSKDNSDKRIDKDILVSNDNIKIVKDTRLNLSFLDDTSHLNIFIEDNVSVVITIISKYSRNEINYNLGYNSKLTVNHLAIDNSDIINIKLFKEKASCNYNYSIINYKDNKYMINVYHEASNTTSNIYNHGVNLLDKNLDFVVNGKVVETSSDSICNQDNKIISANSNHASIEPNLFIDNYKVIANHSAYIGNFKEDIMFYLNSRGISKKDSYKLLLKSFLVGKMDLEYEEKEEILNIINSIGGE